MFEPLRGTCRSIGLGFPLLVLVMLTSGCAVSTERSLPGWVMNPPSDDADAIRGVGEGDSMEDARNNALGVIAGKLRTRVQAEVQTERTLEDGEESSFTRNRVQTTTEALRLSDYEVLKTATSGNRRFVLLEVDRPNLVRSLRSELETLDEELQGTLGGPATSLKRLTRLNRSEERIREALALLSLIASIDGSADLSGKRSKYNGLLAEREQLFQSLRIGIQTDAETAVLGDHITTLLLDQGIHAESASPGKDYSGILRITGESKLADMFDEKHVRLKVRLNLIGGEGDSVTNSRYQAAASSLSSYASAKASANRLVAEKIEQQGIWQALKLEGGQ